MLKIQKLIKFTKSDIVFFIILLILIFFSFIILSPKISSLLLSFKRQLVLNEFLKNATSRGINPQEYWKFREFYSPGYFNFSRTGIDDSSLKQAENNIGIKYNNKEINLRFLIFSSSRVNSVDMLTTQSNLNRLIDVKQLQKNQIVFRKNGTLIYKKDPKTIQIAFLLSNAEMKKANGFFDYTDKDKKITEGENWLNITSIKTD